MGRELRSPSHKGEKRGEPPPPFTFSWTSSLWLSRIVIMSRPPLKAHVTWNAVLHVFTQHWMHAPVRSRHSAHTSSQRLACNTHARTLQHSRTLQHTRMLQHTHACRMHAPVRSRQSAHTSSQRLACNVHARTNLISLTITYLSCSFAYNIYVILGAFENENLAPDSSFYWNAEIVSTSPLPTPPLPLPPPPAPHRPPASTYRDVRDLCDRLHLLRTSDAHFRDPERAADVSPLRATPTALWVINGRRKFPPPVYRITVRYSARHHIH